MNNEYFRWYKRFGSWKISATELRWVHRRITPQFTTTVCGQMAWLILLQPWLGVSNVSKSGSRTLPKITGWFVVQYEACLRELSCDVSKGISRDVWLSSSVRSVCKFYKHFFLLKLPHPTSDCLHQPIYSHTLAAYSDKCWGEEFFLQPRARQWHIWTARLHSLPFRLTLN
jgi:hypothetical protein